MKDRDPFGWRIFGWAPKRAGAQEKSRAEPDGSSARPNVP